MKKKLLIFLRLFVVLIGIVVLVVLIRFPLTEGRAKNLDLFSIYLDPFILYIYATSIAFFIALYKIFKLFGYMEQNKVFSTNTVKTLKSIKYCAVVLSILIVMAGLFIRITHNKDEDPAGFFAICMLSTFVSLVVAIVAAIFEKKLKNSLNLKSEIGLIV